MVVDFFYLNHIVYHCHQSRPLPLPKQAILCLPTVDLLAFAGRVREMGFLIKLDTNGYRPDVLETMLDAGLVD